MEKINFFIDHLDPLGQGVSKLDGAITFIKKTLPGESGEAYVFRKAKGVQFAFIKEIRERSTNRVEPACPHFSECNGCSYMHTSYESELEFKRNAAIYWLKRLDCKNKFLESLKIIGDKKRFNYRNRVQLHYDKNRLGYIDPKTKKILEVKECLLPIGPIREKMRELYNNKDRFLKGQKNRGHVELISRDHLSVQTIFNQSYSSGGFLQVNSDMNDILKDLVKDLTSVLKVDTVLDLFGGDGNLSHNISYKKRFIVDYKTCGRSSAKERFISFDLFKKNALQLKEKIEGNIDLMIIDPPRAGLKELKSYVECFSPKYFLYVSCNISTMVRDLRDLPNIQIISSKVIDIFPLTEHFETVLLVENRNF